MATTTKNRANKAKAKPRRPVAKKSQAKQTPTIESLRRELAESLARETATSEILRMNAGAPPDPPSAHAGLERHRHLSHCLGLNRMAMITSHA